MSIGELWARSGLAPHVLRHWEAMVEHALGCDEHDFTQCPNFRRLVADLAEGTAG
jgi:hypothetical protein